MIAGCPRCEAKYRVDLSRIGPDGARLQCARCGGVFRVQAPAPAPSQPFTPARAERVPAPSASGAAATGACVLVADSNADFAKDTAAALAALGLQPIVVHDGAEAMLAVQRHLPRAAILELQLPGMHGYQVCEIVKRNESLRGIRVVLLTGDRGDERVPLSEPLTPDATFARSLLASELPPLLRSFGLELREPAVSQSPGPSSGAAAAAAEGFSFDPGDAAAQPSAPEPAGTAGPGGAEADLDFELGGGSDFEEDLEPDLDPDFGIEATGDASAAAAASERADFDSEFASSDRTLRPDHEEAPASQARPDADEELLEFEQSLSEFEPPEAPVDEEGSEAATPPSNPGLDEERAQAERLARIIVSDIVLYNPEKFAAAAASPNVVAEMEPDLAEGRVLFSQRVDARVGQERDFLGEELERVARERAGR